MQALEMVVSSVTQMVLKGGLCMRPVCTHMFIVCWRDSQHGGWLPGAQERLSGAPSGACCNGISQLGQSGGSTAGSKVESTRLGSGVAVGKAEGRGLSKTSLRPLAAAAGWAVTPLLSGEPWKVWGQGWRRRGECGLGFTKFEVFGGLQLEQWSRKHTATRGPSSEKFGSRHEFVSSCYARPLRLGPLVKKDKRT